MEKALRKKITNWLVAREIFYWLVLRSAKLLPHMPVRDYERYPRWLKRHDRIFTAARHAINRAPVEWREKIAINYLIPTINILFDKNYINYAHVLLLALEEYFLSLNSERAFEEGLASFSSHAIAAGERFRAKFPLPSFPDHNSPSIGFVGHSVAVSGYEVIMELCARLAKFKPSMYSCRVFDARNELTVAESFQMCGVNLFVTEKRRYDIFALRRLLIQYPVDIAIWPMPPFHMFFLFAFGVAPKQVFFSQYLRPNLEFKYVDGTLTLGGAGTLATKTYNSKEWYILPQVVVLPDIGNGPSGRLKRKYLFVPARLEKLKQPDFMECVAEILTRAPNAHLKWTGYYRDEEVDEFFRKRALSTRHTFLHWMNAKALHQEIKTSNLILSTFPLALGTVENVAAYYGVPIVSMYDDEHNLYWRDIHWEAINGNKALQAICLDAAGRSKILIAKTPDEYVSAALRLLSDDELVKTYVQVYRQAHHYTYFENPNRIDDLFSNYVNTLHHS